MVNMESGQNRSLSPMTAADSRHPKRPALFRTARLEFLLQLTASLHRPSRESRREDSFERATIVIKPGEKKTLRIEKQRSAQGALNQRPKSLSTDRTLLRLSPRRREPRSSQIEDSVSRTMLVGCETRRYPTETDVSAVFKRK